MKSAISRFHNVRILVKQDRSFSSLIVMGIETSCDDTSVCLLEWKKEKNNGDNGGNNSSGRSGHISIEDCNILYEQTMSQEATHCSYGGIVPTLAAQRHRQSIPRLFSQVSLFLKRKNENNKNRSSNGSNGHIDGSSARDSLFGLGVDIVAATRGPGIWSCLSVGWNAARSVSSLGRVPLLGMHHMEGHLLMPMLFNREISFPFLCLLVSGGHTMIVYGKSLHSYEIIGKTLDDSIGEAFDKGGRYLQLSWTKDCTFGQSLEKAALLAKEQRKADKEKLGNDNYGDKICNSDDCGGDKILFIEPLNKSDNFRENKMNFSFCGLKTQLKHQIKRKVLKHCNNIGGDGEEYLKNVHLLPCSLANELACSYQDALINHVASRLRNAVGYLYHRCLPINCLIVSGGVAKNELLRSSLVEVGSEFGLPTYFPPPKYCMDNALMIAYAGLLRYHHKYKDKHKDEDDGGGCHPADLPVDGHFCSTFGDDCGLEPCQSWSLQQENSNELYSQ